MRTIREFRHAIREIEREVAYQLKHQSDCCGVTMAQCHCLMELEDLGAVGIMDLAQRLRLDTSTLSRTVDSLVRAGYVERTANPADRRCVTLRLTEHGLSKAAEINAACDGFYVELFQDFSPDQEALLKAVKSLASIIARKRGRTCCPGAKP